MEPKKNENPAEVPEEETPLPPTPPASDPGAEPTPPEPAEKPGEATPTSPEPSPKSDPFGIIGQAFTQEWPEPQAHFVKAVKEEAEKQAAEEGGKVDFRLLKDRKGLYFNPAVCVEDVDPKTGIPVKTTTGLWHLKRGHKRSELKTRPPKIGDKPGDKTAADIDAERAALEAARLEMEKRLEMTARMGDSLAWIVIEASTGTGADGATQKAGIEALRLWLSTMERPPEPPAWSVPIFIYGQAFARRFAADRAAPRRQALREKIGNAVAYFKGRRAAKKAAKQEGRGEA